MISIVRLYNTVNQLAKTDTSGYQTEAEFNNDVFAVQEDLMTTFTPLYSVNQTVKDILDFLVKSEPIAISSSGQANKPTGYYRGLTGAINGHPCYPIAVNEKDIWNTSPIRKPSVANNIYVYYQENGVLNFLPAQVLTCSFSYIRKPVVASLTLTAVSTEDNDFVTPTAVTDLEWNENVFNLFVYKMLDRLGLEQKESLNLEYSRLGINTELSKI